MLGSVGTGSRAWYGYMQKKQEIIVWIESDKSGEVLAVVFMTVFTSSSLTMLEFGELEKVWGFGMSRLICNGDVFSQQCIFGGLMVPQN